ncbi:hypothetical protein KIS4809_4949 [Bacillus sp. ZZV12-4809]|nr:hypothetical protein KIS4809_4949 [Bacillus sp. ZZV12-4809]
MLYVRTGILPSLFFVEKEFRFFYCQLPAGIYELAEKLYFF